jgi:hypothetical protein
LNIVDLRRAVAVDEREARCGSRPSTVFMIDRMGVMPLPPATPR